MLFSICIIRGIGYCAPGEFSQEILVLFAATLPAVLLGIYLGNHIHIRLSELAFKKLVIFSLFLCGVPLVFV